MDTYKPRFTHAGQSVEPDRIYLLSTHTEGGQPWFVDWRVGRACVRELIVLHRFGLVTSLAWVLLPDALHWLTVVHEFPLNYLLRRFKSRSALMVNKALGRSGPVWRYGFDRRMIRDDEDLVAVSHDILALPIDAGLARRIGYYPLWDAWWVGTDRAGSLLGSEFGRFDVARDASGSLGSAVKAEQ